MENKNEIITRNQTTVTAGKFFREMLIRLLQRFTIEYDGQQERLNLNYNHTNGKLIQVKVSSNR